MTELLAVVAITFFAVISPGPDFVLVVHCHDMPDYLALAQRLFTSDANVRNIKAFFSLKRAKFDPRLALPLKGSS